MARTHKQMSEETQQKLLEIARIAFAEKGFAGASMEDFTAQVGLTRGALYHHFGDKKGLFQAVVAQMDREMHAKLKEIQAQSSDPWQGFMAENCAYLAMVLEPSFQQIMLNDAPAILGESLTADCVQHFIQLLANLQQAQIIKPLALEPTAYLLQGGIQSIARWIAHHSEPETALAEGQRAFEEWVEGMLRENGNFVAR